MEGLEQAIRLPFKGPGGGDVFRINNQLLVFPPHQSIPFVVKDGCMWDVTVSPPQFVSFLKVPPMCRHLCPPGSCSYPGQESGNGTILFPQAELPMAEEVVTTFTPRAKEPSPRPRACTADDPPVAQPLVPPLHMPDPQETASPPQFQETSEAQMVVPTGYYGPNGGPIVYSESEFWLLDPGGQNPFLLSGGHIISISPADGHATVVGQLALPPEVLKKRVFKGFGSYQSEWEAAPQVDEKTRTLPKNTVRGLKTLITTWKGPVKAEGSIDKGKVLPGTLMEDFIGYMELREAEILAKTEQRMEAKFREEHLREKKRAAKEKKERKKRRENKKKKQGSGNVDGENNERLERDKLAKEAEELRLEEERIRLEEKKRRIEEARVQLEREKQLEKERCRVELEREQKSFSSVTTQGRDSSPNVQRKVQQHSVDRTRLFQMIRSGNTDDVIDQIKDPNVGPDVVDERRFSALHVACEYGHLPLVELLLYYGARIEVRDKYQATPLHQSVKLGHVLVAKRLLNGGANLEAMDKDGARPLHWACERGFENCVELFLQHGADVNAMAKFNSTPLHIAARNGHNDLIQMLVDAGAGVEDETTHGYCALHIACMKGHTPVVQELLRLGSRMFAKTKEGFSPLHIAVMQEHVDLAAFLLKEGASVNAADEAMTRPVHIACSHGNDSMVQLLLSNDAAVDVLDSKGRTPLHRAVMGKHVSVLDLLLPYHPAIIEDSNGRTPLDIAVLQKGAVFAKMANRIQMYMRGGKSSAPAKREDETTAKVLERIAIQQRLGSNVVDLSLFKLTAIPPQVFEMECLEVLKATHNRLSILQPNIRSLTSLTHLNICSNEISVIPEVIGYLARLRILELNNNRLRELPKQIGLLQELRTLRASNNEIKAIPPEIGFCVSLETLDLSGNKLAAVAPQIGRLVALHNVYFNNNSLQSVASELGLCKDIVNLQLTNNAIAELPTSLMQLRNLDTLGLEGNPMVFPPQEVVKGGPTVIRAFLHKVFKGATPCEAARLVDPNRANQDKYRGFSLEHMVKSAASRASLHENQNRRFSWRGSPTDLQNHSPGVSPVGTPARSRKAVTETPVEGRVRMKPLPRPPDEEEEREVDRSRAKPLPPPPEEYSSDDEDYVRRQKPLPPPPPDEDDDY